MTKQEKEAQEYVHKTLIPNIYERLTQVENMVKELYNKQ